MFESLNFGLTPPWQGSRTPVTDPLAKGALVGLSLSHTRAHVWRALLEVHTPSILDPTPSILGPTPSILHPDPLAKGALAGLSLSHTRVHVWRALLEVSIPPPGR